MADHQGPKPQGFRKDGKPFKADNTRDDGTYAVGKNRPPEAGRFTKGDGRKRGKRKKGVRNHDSEFMEELGRKVVVRENGHERKVSKGRAADIRLIENGVAKGQNKALEMIDERRRRIADKEEQARLYNTASDEEILEGWFTHMQARNAIDPATYGDPKPAPRRQGKGKGTSS